MCCRGQCIFTLFLTPGVLRVAFLQNSAPGAGVGGVSEHNLCTSHSRSRLPVINSGSDLFIMATAGKCVNKLVFGV